MAKSEAKKPNIFKRIAKWFREMKSELKKVVWPSRKQLIKNTIIVLVCCVVVGVFIWLFDWVAGVAVKALIAALR